MLVLAGNAWKVQLRGLETNKFSVQSDGLSSGAQPQYVLLIFSSGPFWPDRCFQWEIVWEGVQGDITEIMRSALATFPPPDVVADLLHLYFLHVNTQFPLLHRPTFDRQWKAKLFERDIWFTAVCLSIFAVAGRWSQDPRILPAVALTETGDLDWTRVGWNYFDMVIGQSSNSLLEFGS